MQSIPLSQIPNQELEVEISELGLNLIIQLKQFEDLLVMNLYQDDRIIFLSMNCKPFYDMLNCFSYKIPKLHLFFVSEIENFSYKHLDKEAFLYYDII